MRNMSQRKTISASFINTWSFMSLLDNRQLKIVTKVFLGLENRNKLKYINLGIAKLTINRFIFLGSLKLIQVTYELHKIRF